MPLTPTQLSDSLTLISWHKRHWNDRFYHLKHTNSAIECVCCGQIICPGTDHVYRVSGGGELPNWVTNASFCKTLALEHGLELVPIYEGAQHFTWEPMARFAKTKRAANLSKK